MNCSVCGGVISSKQKFCRSCGTMISTGELAPASEFGSPNRDGRFVFVAFAVMFIGVAIGVVGKLVLLNPIVTTMGVLVALLGMLLSVYPYLVKRSPRRVQFDETHSPKDLHEVHATRKLPSVAAIDQVPSVTEHTTTRLEIPRKEDHD